MKTELCKGCNHEINYKNNENIFFENCQSCKDTYQIFKKYQNYPKINPNIAFKSIKMRYGKALKTLSKGAKLSDLGSNFGAVCWTYS